MIPTDKMILQIEEATRLRGWIANSYSQVEYLLGDLILRLRSETIYAEHTQTLPHDASNRVRKIKAILAIDGPLSAFKTELEEVLSEISRRHQVRNLLAHGFCSYHFTPDGDTGFEFQKWHRDKSDGADDRRLIRTFRMLDLQREMETSVAAAQRALNLYWRLRDHFRWKPRAKDCLIHPKNADPTDAFGG